MLTQFKLNAHMKTRLAALVDTTEDDFSFCRHPELASFVAALGLFQETGTVNDELHRHVRDRLSGAPPLLGSMKAELVTLQGRIGVRIFSTESTDLVLDHLQLIHLLHPCSWDADGRLFQLVLFPKTIADIVSLQNVELVIVKSWALNTVFGRFNQQKNFYVTNDWEIRRNDGLRMTRLITQRQLAFTGTHDLVAHIAGTDGNNWDRLQKLGSEISTVMASGHQESITHLLVPYIIGVLLDDLAQPVHYDCPRRLLAIGSLAALQPWVVQSVPATRHFLRFPRAFSKLIEDPRKSSFTPSSLQALISELSLELQILSFEKV